MAIEVRLLSPRDNRSLFASGNIDLDRYFKRYAGQNHFRHHVGSTYIALEDDSILGFITLSVTSIERNAVPNKKLPNYPLPALRISRLAVAAHSQGRGIGSLLLRTAFSVAHQISDLAGCVAVVTDAKPDAIEFYKRIGFSELTVLEGALGDRPSPTPMAIPLAEIPKPST